MPPPSTEFLTVVDWADFQAYKDRNPPWLKLYRSLLDNPDWFRLSGDAGKLLIELWIVAAGDDGNLPSFDDISWRIRKPAREISRCVDELVDAHFLAWAEERLGKATWPSRYIPTKVRAEVMERDRHACVWCQSKERLEVGYKIPVSENGTSEPENLQVLCRSCNRKKRASRSSEQDATQMRSTSREEERREEKKKPIDESLHKRGIILVRSFCKRLDARWDLNIDLQDWVLTLYVQYPEVDVNQAILECTEYFESKGEEVKSPSGRIRNWLKNAVKYAKAESGQKAADEFDPTIMESV